MENVVSSFCWIDFTDDDDEEDFFDENELLVEFEKMLNGDTNKYKEVSEKEQDDKQKSCYDHSWEIVGRGPVSDIPWYNCKKCGITKEEYEKG